MKTGSARKSWNPFVAGTSGKTRGWEAGPDRTGRAGGQNAGGARPGKCSRG